MSHRYGLNYRLSRFMPNYTAGEVPRSIVMSQEQVASLAGGEGGPVWSNGEILPILWVFSIRGELPEEKIRP